MNGANGQSKYKVSTNEYARCPVSEYALWITTVIYDILWCRWLVPSYRQSERAG
jgi:hypothetical protein